MSGWHRGDISPDDLSGNTGLHRDPDGRYTPDDHAESSIPRAGVTERFPPVSWGDRDVDVVSNGRSADPHDSGEFPPYGDAAAYGEPAGHDDATAYSDPSTYADPAAYSDPGGYGGTAAYADPARYGETARYEDLSYADPAPYDASAHDDDLSPYAEPGRYEEPASYADPGSYADPAGYTDASDYDSLARYDDSASYADPAAYEDPAPNGDAAYYGEPAGHDDTAAHSATPSYADPAAYESAVYEDFSRHDPSADPNEISAFVPERSGAATPPDVEAASAAKAASAAEARDDLASSVVETPGDVETPAEDEPGDGGDGDSGDDGHVNAPLGTGASPGLQARPGKVRREGLLTRLVPSAFTGTVAGVTGVLMLLGIGGWALVDLAASCDARNPIRLEVATAPDVAPAVGAIVKDFNAEPPDVDGRCVRAVAKPADPAASAALLSGQGSAVGQSQPDVWIPDSSLWVTVVHSSERGRVTVSSTPTSVARSPIVAAIPRSQASKLSKSGGRPTWNALLKASGTLGGATKGNLFPPGSIRIQALDPSRYAGGLAPLVMTHMMLHNDPKADEILEGVIRGIQQNVAADPAALLGQFKRDGSGRWPVAVLPEQAVWQHNRGRPADDQAVALYPSDGTITMNYPYSLVTKDPDKLRGAELLRVAMNTPRARAAVHRLGFRTADDGVGQGFGPNTGLSPEVPYGLPTPTGKDVDLVIQTWGKLTLSTQGFRPLRTSRPAIDPTP